jgi:2-polyprenyl-3-methyl-5-hydroxy-6-metoxy-1,4-benzoquinol methylase
MNGRTAENDIAREVWAGVMATHPKYDLPIGPVNVSGFVLDPKRMTFFGSRYKFASKMLRNSKSILDVGCGDGWGIMTLLSDTAAQNIVGCDFESELINYANEHLMAAIKALRPQDVARVQFLNQEFVEGDWQGFDGVSCLDVIEHVPKSKADNFLGRMADAMSENGVAVIGTPNEFAHQYASIHSQVGHINLYSPDRFYKELGRHFHNVFRFSMNDEVVHTGFDQLAHYLLALCVGPVRRDV